jgi:hypothetical protein
MLNTYNSKDINPLKAELNPVCLVLTLLGPHHIIHVSRTRVKKYQEVQNVYLSVRHVSYVCV